MPATLEKKKVQRRSQSLKKPRTIGKGYNAVKFYGGKQYTGMPVGRGHKWYYDKGEWHDTKITPELWQISFNVTKRRAGHAPFESGASVGTGYHWFIFAHQVVKKLNKDDYSTELTGLKYKLSHKRAAKGKWNNSAANQRKKLIQFLKDMIKDLEQEPLKIELEYEGESYKGEAMPVLASCSGGKCFEYAVSLENGHIGMLKNLKSGWKMDNAADPKFIKTIGKAIDAALENK